RKNPVDSDVAFVGRNLCSGEKAISAVMDNDIARDIVVERDAFETVDRFVLRLSRNTGYGRPSEARSWAARSRRELPESSHLRTVERGRVSRNERRLYDQGGEVIAVR